MYQERTTWRVHLALDAIGGLRGHGGRNRLIAQKLSRCSAGRQRHQPAAPSHFALPYHVLPHAGLTLFLLPWEDSRGSCMRKHSTGSTYTPCKRADSHHCHKKHTLEEGSVLDQPASLDPADEDCARRIPGPDDAAIRQRQRRRVPRLIGLQPHQLARAEAHAAGRAAAQQVRAQPPPAHPAWSAAPGGCR